MDKKISVVVPTYKRPQLLMKCLQSLVGQTFGRDHYEIIVVSDGADEATAEVMSQWVDVRRPPLTYYTLPRKKGPAAARNEGWQKAKGKLIAFTDDDCIADPSWLSALWAAYQKTETDVAFSGRIIVPVSSSPTDFERNLRGLEQAEFVTANCACSYLALMKVGGFDEQYDMAWREDSDLQFKFIEKNIPIHRLEEAVVVHPIRNVGWGVSVKEQKKTMYNALLYKKFPKLYREKIKPGTPWHYYLIVVSFLTFLILSFAGFEIMTKISFVLWSVSTMIFIIKRLIKTSWSPIHVLEMIFTSIIIPFLSLYWRFYGSIKYRTLFI